MRLYSPSSCTPVVMRNLPSKWRSQHHFLPLLDTVPVSSAQSDRDRVFRRAKDKLKVGSFNLPEVNKSSTNTTASTSPERNKKPEHSEASEDDETISFSDLPQRSSYESFHFDLDTRPDIAIEPQQQETCDESSSSSTVSTKSMPLLGKDIDLLSFEEFTGDEFEDVQPSKHQSETSPFIICKRNTGHEGEIDSEIDQLFISTSTKKNTFPPIDKPNKPPQVPLVVANPVAVTEKTNNRSSISGLKALLPRREAGIPPQAPCSFRDPAKNEDMELLERSPHREKYLRMLKVGLPMAAVRLEMSKDGVSPTKKRVDGLTNRSDVQRFRIHWENFHPVSKPSAPSLWNHIRSDDEWLDELEVDPEEMKALFERDQSAKTMQTNLPKQQSLIRVIEPKRANNCAIFLASLDFTCSEIAAAIDCLNHEAFSLEQIDDLLKFLPTNKEAEVLRVNLKAKPNARHLEGEKYMIEMIKVEDATTKLEIMSVMKRFPVVCNVVANHAKVLKVACEDIILSSGLRKTISLILHLGNIVNKSGGKSEVDAVRISCLLKLSQTRSFDAKTSFLDYAASVAWKNGASIDFPASLNLAVKLDWKTTVAEFEKLDNKLPQIRQFALKDCSNFLEDDEELNLLKSTSTGRFAIDAYRKAASAYAEMQDIQACFRRLCDYFGESSEDPQKLIKEVDAFCNQFRSSVAKMKHTSGTSSPLPRILEISGSFGSI